MWLFADVNLFSMHATYVNRLVRCYLGATRRKPWYKYARMGAPTGSDGSERDENPVTGFDFSDDMPLQRLRYRRKQDGDGEDRPYWGPFPIINAALNLTGGRELAWQDRKADAFFFSPLYCGSKSTGFRFLPASNDTVTLGRAMGISGAAVSPNMGYLTSQSLMILLTMFNVRLGWWLYNPARPQRFASEWHFKHPGYGGLVWNEMLGRTDEDSGYVYLSDGGHFDNLGVYELIRRRCKYIIVSDAGADPKYQFRDLTDLVQKIQTDFGISIADETDPRIVHRAANPLDDLRRHSLRERCRTPSVDICESERKLHAVSRAKRPA